MAVIITVAIVAKIAMPPPSGIGDWLYLSAEGRETKPLRNDDFLTIAVNSTVSKNAPAGKTIDIKVNVEILIAPLI